MVCSGNTIAQCAVDIMSSLNSQARAVQASRLPKQLRKLNININQELFLSWWSDMAIVWQFGMVMVRMSRKHLAERGRRVACIGSCPFWLGYRQCRVKLLRGHVRNFWETSTIFQSAGRVLEARATFSLTVQLLCPDSEQGHRNEFRIPCLLPPNMTTV